MTDIRQLLMEANPVASRVEVPDVVRAEVMAEVHRTPPRRRFTRRWQWPLPTILVALVAAGGVATAAAVLISRESKQQSTALASGPPVPANAGRAVAFAPAKQIGRFFAALPSNPAAGASSTPATLSSFAKSPFGTMAKRACNLLIQHYEIVMRNLHGPVVFLTLVRMTETPMFTRVDWTTVLLR